MYLAGVHLHAGDLHGASALIEEGDAITAATRYAPVTYAALNLVAWQGDESAAQRLLERAVEDATLRGETVVRGLAGHVTAVLYNGLGRYDLALAGARRAAGHDVLLFVGWALVELVEAGVRTGHVDEARAARKLLRERTRAGGTDWALGIQARCDALLSEGDAADRLYREAIDRLARSRVTIHLARAHLLYGEWLRRERRRQQARDQLRLAHDMFAAMGADAFAERSRRELNATGQTVRGRTGGTPDRLTPQEFQIARLAGQGLTNPEIGAQLFISPHTVEWHLRKVFTKLRITSRKQLGAALPAAAGAERS
jgi:DNA-binding CsgD family transcriptional regulator/tetratricopeptide (TPR) repeat protein